MLLSFSVDSMLPYIVSGLKQCSGLDVGDARVKRQTIRGRGPRNAKLLLEAPKQYHPGQLHMWWKSRTKDRKELGVVMGFQIYPLRILRRDTHKGARVIVDIGDYGNFMNGEAGFKKFVHDDGFESEDEFRDFFFKDGAEEFAGVLFRW